MPKNLVPLTGSFGVRITGVDVRRLAPREHAARIDAANRSGVVHIPDQILSDTEQLAFTELFGPIRILRVNHARTSKRPPGIVENPDVDAEGKLIPPDSQVLRFSKGNRLWHLDHSYTERHAAQPILFAEEAVSKGGETEFADMAAAHDALPATVQQRLAGLTAGHDRFQFRIKSGFMDFTAEEYARSPPVAHPLVSIHPTTGRKGF